MTKRRIADNLYIRTRPNGRAVYTFRFMQDGKAREIGLGSTDIVSRAAAKRKALEYRLMLHEGRNPLAEKQRLSAGATFDEMAAAYIEAHKAGWRDGGKSATQWQASLKAYASPVIGPRPIGRISANDLADILRPIWIEKAETARRVRGRIERVLNFAAAHGTPYSGERNPASLEILRHMLPQRRQTVKHHAAILVGDIPAFAADLKSRDNVSAKALLFVLLTVARTSEAIGATWDEIDMDAQTWTLSAERMKAARPHVVPLVPAAVELLRSLPHGEWVFAGPNGKLSNMALLEQMRQIRGRGATVHGLRASFKTWASEKTETPREIVEGCLAHTIGGKVERAYQRGQLIEKRRALLLAWSRFCFGVVSGNRTREVDINSYMELALAPQAADIAHPAFSKMFVETEYLADSGTIVATRRRRGPSEPEIWAAHLAVVDGKALGRPQFETDRARFLGRCHTIHDPIAMGAGRLSNTAGTVLDPIFALRRRVQVPPGATVHVAFWTMLAQTRTELLDMIDKHRDRTAFGRAATLAWTQGQVQLHHLGITTGEASLFQRLAGHVIHAGPSLRPTSDMILQGAASQPGLWAQGISGDRPIVLLRIADIDNLDIAHQLLQAHEYWRINQLAVDVVILNERQSSYVQDLQTALETQLRTSQSRRPVASDMPCSRFSIPSTMPARARTSTVTRWSRMSSRRMFTPTLLISGGAAGHGIRALPAGCTVQGSKASSDCGCAARSCIWIRASRRAGRISR